MDTLELIDDIKDISNKSNEIKNNNQKGGYVFNLLFFALTPFVAIGRYFVEGLKSFGKLLFMFYITDKNGKSTLPYTKPNEGLFWKFLWVSLKVGLYLVVFAFGGLGVTIFGMGYLYSRLFGLMTKKPASANDLE